MSDRVSVPRIGRVRLKGGADLRLLHNPQEEHQRKTVAAARAHVSSMECDPSAVGYVLVWWDSAGDWRAGWRIGRRGPITESLMPTFVHDVLIREVTATSVERTFNTEIPQGEA